MSLCISNPPDLATIVQTFKWNDTSYFELRLHSGSPSLPNFSNYDTLGTNNSRFNTRRYNVVHIPITIALKKIPYLVEKKKVKNVIILPRPNVRIIFRNKHRKKILHERDGSTLQIPASSPSCEFMKF